jgi:hypothetical protein
VPNQASSGPERFTFNVHLSKPPEPVVPANLRPKVDGVTAGVPNGNPRRYKPKPVEMATEAKDSGKDGKTRDTWRKVLRQRIQKKKRSRLARGWGDTPGVLGAVMAP